MTGLHCPGAFVAEKVRNREAQVGSTLLRALEQEKSTSREAQMDTALGALEEEKLKIKAQGSVIPHFYHSSSFFKK